MRYGRVVPLLTVLLLSLPVGASAQWSAIASGSAETRADDMTNATNFTAACTNKTSNSSVTLTWTASPDLYVSGYHLVRTSSNGTVASGTLSGRTTVSYTDNISQPAGQTFTYTIRAVSSGTSWSTTATTASGQPSYTGPKNGCVTL